MTRAHTSAGTRLIWLSPFSHTSASDDSRTVFMIHYNFETSTGGEKVMPRHKYPLANFLRRTTRRWDLVLITSPLSILSIFCDLGSAGTAWDIITGHCWAAKNLPCS